MSNSFPSILYAERVYKVICNLLNRSQISICASIVAYGKGMSRISHIHYQMVSYTAIGDYFHL